MAVLCASVAYTLVRLQNTSALLEEAQEGYFIQEARRRFTALEDFLSHALAESEDIAANRAIETYYVNKALGMSLKYGLGVALTAMGEEFEHLRSSAQEGGESIFRWIAYFDRDQDKIIAETAPSTDALGPPQAVYALIGSQGATRNRIQAFCEKGRCHIFMLRPFAFHGEQKGALVIDLNIEIAASRLFAKKGGERLDFSGLVGPDGVLVIGPKDLLGKSIEDTLGVVPSRLSDFDLIEKDSSKLSGGEPLLVTGDRIPGTGFQFIAAAPRSRYLPGTFTSHWNMLIGALILGLLVILCVFFKAFRDRYRIYRELEESHLELESRVTARTSDLARKNEELIEQMAERARAERALAASEERYRELVQEAGDIIFSTDAKGRFSFVNNIGLRITGFSEAEILGKPFTAFIHPEFREQAQEFYVRQLREKVGTTYFEFPSLTKSGETVWLGQSTRLLRDGDVILGFQSISRDITELKKTEAELREAKKAAEAGNQAKSEFLARMSHEIRTPINAVMGYSELLMDDDLSEEQRNALETIRLSTETLLTLVDDILDLSRVEADKIELDYVPFNIESLALDACEMLRGRARDKSIELLCDVSEIPTHLIGDPVRIRQVLTNLLTNAIKFTQRGEILTTISVLERSGDNVKVEIVVKDSGIGIPEDRLEAIFEVFTQAHAFTAHEYGGAGLGLAICRRFARLMHGEITAESRVGEGSVFRFTAQLSALASEAEGVPDPIPVEDLRGKKALLVDDSPTSLRILEDTLKRVGVDAVAATGATDALKELETRSVDFALVDIRMPAVDGYDFAAMVRSNYSAHCPKLIALSSDPQWRSRERLATGAFDGYLVKPVRRHALFSMIRTVLGLTHKAERRITELSLKSPKSVCARVLLAEDNPVNQQMTLKKLAKLGIDADLARNGAEAVEKAGSRHYDLILMDMHMPVLDGVNAAREIRRVGITCPIVALTASAMREDMERCLAAGMNEFMSKPVRTKNLTEALARYCGLPQSDNGAENLRILVADGDIRVTRMLGEIIKKYRPTATTAFAGNSAQACVRIGSFFPHVLVLDLSLPDLPVKDLMQFMRSDERLSKIRVLGAIPDEQYDDLGIPAGRAGITNMLRKPFDEGDAMAALEALFSGAGEEEDVMREGSPQSFINAAAEELGIEPQEYVEIAAEFLDDVTERLKTLSDALQENHADTVAQIAHTIKGGAAQMLLDHIAGPAALLEQAAKQGEISGGAAAMEAMHAGLDQFRKALEAAST